MLIARSHLTRVLHLAVLLTVVEQLLTSQFMERPLPGEAPDWPFALHEQVGLVGLGVLMLFWLWTLVRDERETPLQRLFPWFSSEPLSEVVANIKAIVRAVARRRAPPLHLDALSSAVTCSRPRGGRAWASSHQMGSTPTVCTAPMRFITPPNSRNVPAAKTSRDCRRSRAAAYATVRKASGTTYAT